MVDEEYIYMFIFYKVSNPIIKKSSVPIVFNLDIMENIVRELYTELRIKRDHDI